MQVRAITKQGLIDLRGNALYGIRALLYDSWHMFWHRLIYKSRMVGNYRKVINRFTGEHKVYKVHSLARIGVSFSKEQIEFINALLKNERTHDAQELILQEIEKEMNFDGLAEAFIIAAQQASESEQIAARFWAH